MEEEVLGLWLFCAAEWNTGGPYIPLWTLFPSFSSIFHLLSFSSLIDDPFFLYWLPLLSHSIHPSIIFSLHLFFIFCGTHSVFPFNPFIPLFHIVSNFSPFSPSFLFFLLLLCSMLSSLPSMLSVLSFSLILLILPLISSLDFQFLCWLHLCKVLCLPSLLYIHLSLLLFYNKKLPPPHYLIFFSSISLWGTAEVILCS